MNRRGDNDMGQVMTEITVANYEDVLRSKAGTLAPERVRQIKLEGLVDTGALRLVLPATVVKQLGLPTVDKVKVRYADQRTAVRLRVGNAWVKLQGRASDFTAIAEPKRTTALIGAIVLEELDFVVNCITEKLEPRDPKQIVTEIE